MAKPKSPNSRSWPGRVTPGRPLGSSRRRSGRTSDWNSFRCNKAKDQDIPGHCLRLVQTFLSYGTEMREPGIVSFACREYEDVIYVLHCFERKSREMPRRDFE